MIRDLQTVHFPIKLFLVSTFASIKFKHCGHLIFTIFVWLFIFIPPTNEINVKKRNELSSDKIIELMDIKHKLEAENMTLTKEEVERLKTFLERKNEIRKQQIKTVNTTGKGCFADYIDEREKQ